MLRQVWLSQTTGQEKQDLYLVSCCFISLKMQMNLLETQTYFDWNITFDL